MVIFSKKILRNENKKIIDNSNKENKQKLRENANQTIMKGAIVLSLAGMIVKILSAVYRVPFQNLVGNTGFYVYQQVYPIYGIGMTFALSGFPVFMSHLIAQEQNRTKQKIMMQQSFLIVLLLGVICFCSLFFGSGIIADLMGDSDLSPIVKSVAWMFLLMPFLVISRGYFQGNFQVIPTAISQIVEQIIRISVILIVAFLYSCGLFSLYQMGKWAMFSATIAGVGASFILYRYLVKDWQKEGQIKFLDDILHIEAKKDYSLARLSHRFLTEGGTICLVSSMLVLFQLVDSFTAYKGLVAHGINPDIAKSLKGIYDRGQPLVQLGMVVGIGFTASYLPMLAKSYAKGRLVEFRRNAQSLMKLTLLLSLMATVGMMAILPRLNHILFGDTSGNKVIMIYIISVLIASVIMAHNGILQSIAQYRVTLVGLLIGLVIKMLLNHILIRYFDLAGASLATLLGLLTMEIVMIYLSPVFLKKMIGKSVLNGHILAIGLLVFSSVFLCDALIAEIVPHGVTRMGDFVIVIGEVLLGVFVFLVLVLQKRILTTREWLMLPKGKEFLRYIKNK